jgi:hypothetical protein
MKGEKERRWNFRCFTGIIQLLGTALVFWGKSLRHLPLVAAENYSLSLRPTGIRYFKTQNLTVQMKINYIRNSVFHATYEVFTVMKIQIDVFWVVKTCSVVVGYSRTMLPSSSQRSRYSLSISEIHTAARSVILKLKGKVKVIPVLNQTPRHEVLGSGGTAPCIFNLCIRWRWMISFIRCPLGT